MFMSDIISKHHLHMRTLHYFRSGLLAFALLLTSLVLHGQAEIDVNVTKDSGGGGWYTNPVVWIIGAAVFILLLVAIVRGGGRKD
jgi:hypothetical protein